MQIQHFNVINLALQPYIDYYYLLSTEGDTATVTYQAFPSINTPVCFFNDCVIQLLPGKAIVEKSVAEAFSEIVVGNPIKPVSVSMPPGIKEFCIVFKPLGINNTQAKKMGQLLKHNFSATNLFGDLKEVISVILNRGEGIVQLENKLLARLQETEELKSLRQIIHLLKENENITFEMISRKVFLTYKNIYRLFLAHTGVSPVKFRNILKFRTAVAKGVGSLYNKKMSEIAIDSGYYDQAHLINEFKKIANHTPKAFMSAITLEADKKIAWKFG